MSSRWRHGLTWPVWYMLSRGVVQCDRRLLAKLRAIDKNELKEKLSRWLTKSEIDGVVARAGKISEFFDKEVAAKGEGAVLYDFPANPASLRYGTIGVDGPVTPCRGPARHSNAAALRFAPSRKIPPRVPHHMAPRRSSSNTLIKAAAPAPDGAYPVNFDGSPFRTPKPGHKKPQVGLNTS